MKWLRWKTVFGGSLALFCVLVCRADVTPGADYEVDAARDADGDEYWEDVVTGNPSGLGLLLDDSPAVTRVPVVSATSLTDAYDFPGGSVGNEAGALLVLADSTATASFQDAPGDWSGNSVTLEVWFRPGNLAPAALNGQILFEDGGGSGLGLFIVDNQLLCSQDLLAAQISYNLLTDPSGLLLGPATNEFIQAVVTRAVGGATELFINGASVGTASDDDSDWSGGDGAAFGTRGEGNTGGLGNGQMDTESFEGQIALIRVYNNQVLSSTEVTNNFVAVATPGPPLRFSGLGAAGITSKSAQLSATINSNLTAATLVWDTVDNGTSLPAWPHSKSLGAQAVGSVSERVSGLTPGVTYYFRFYGEDAATNTWSVAGVFTTPGLINVINTTAVILDDDNGSGNPFSLESTTYTFSFDAGAGADKLIVTLCSEAGSGAPAVITFGGQALTYDPRTDYGNNARVKGIYYLDDPYTGGPTNMVLDMTMYGTVNGAGIGVVSVSGTEPGMGVASNANGTTSISLEPEQDSSLVVAACGMNGLQYVTPDSPMIPLYSSNNIGSACAGSGYALNVPAAPQTFSFSTSLTDGYVVSAAAFYPKVVVVEGAVLLVR